MKTTIYLILLHSLFPASGFSQEPDLERIIQHLQIENITVDVTLKDDSHKVNIPVELVRKDGEGEAQHLAGFSRATYDLKPFPQKTLRLSILFSPDKTSISSFDEQMNRYVLPSLGRGWNDLISSDAPNPDYTGATSYDSMNRKIISFDSSKAPIVLKEFTLNGEVVYQLRLSIAESTAKQ